MNDPARLTKTRKTAKPVFAEYRHIEDSSPKDYYEPELHRWISPIMGGKGKAGEMVRQMVLSAALHADFTKPLSEQKKPDFVCEPGDPRVKGYGWVKSKFRGYLSIEGKTIWVSSVWSIQMGKGNYSRLIKNLHNSGFLIKVPSPFPRMIEICKHLGFIKTTEWFPEAGEMIDVWVLGGGDKC
jgi:hypothetical protein